MTAITFVGANAGVTANNTSLVPTIHASAAAGDVLLLLATIRNTAASVDSVAGWQLLANVGGHVRLYGREYDGVFGAPTVTFTGGAAGDDTTAQIAVFRTLKLYTRLGPTTITNASAQNITLPSAATPGRNSSLLIVLGWKQDDWTSVATLAGMTEIGETIATAGNDAAMVWDYQIQTTAAATPAGPLTVTGGAAAVSKGAFLALDQAAAITAVEQDVYPPRVLVSVTNLVIGDAVTVFRVVGGVRTELRAGSTASTADVAFLVIDAELPFGVPVSYVAVVSGAEYATSAVTYTLPGEKVAISDAVTGQAAEAVILAWPEKAYTRPSTTFKVGGRNVVVSGDLGQFEGVIEFYVETTTSRDNLAELLADATEAIVQIRQPGGYDGVDCYVAVTGVTERRFSQDGSDQRRVVAVQAVEVEGWAPALQAAGFSYADLEAAYTGLTYADLAGDYTTYLDLAQADLS